MILSVDNVSKSFGARVLFKDARLRVGARARIALVGPNGAGKTTLLDIIAARQDADEGGEALRSAEHVTSIEHRLRVLAEDLETAEDGAVQEQLLSEYGRLHDRF